MRPWTNARRISNKLESHQQGRFTGHNRVFNSHFPFHACSSSHLTSTHAEAGRRISVEIVVHFFVSITHAHTHSLRTTYQSGNLLEREEGQHPTYYRVHVHETASNGNATYIQLHLHTYTHPRIHTPNTCTLTRTFYRTHTYPPPTLVQSHPHSATYTHT